VTLGITCRTNPVLFETPGLIRSSMYPVPTVAAMCEQWNLRTFAGQINIK